MSGSQIRVHIRCRLRPCIQAVGVTNPVGAVDIDPAPLMSPLVFVDVLIGDTEDIQAQSCGSGTSGAGGHAQDKIAIGVIIVRYIGGVGHAAVEHPAQLLHDAPKLLLAALFRQRGNDFQRHIIGLLQLSVRAFLSEAGKVRKLVHGDRLKGILLKGNGFPQVGGRHAPNDGGSSTTGNVAVRGEGPLFVIARQNASPVQSVYSIIVAGVGGHVGDSPPKVTPEALQIMMIATIITKIIPATNVDCFFIYISLLIPFIQGGYLNQAVSCRTSPRSICICTDPFSHLQGRKRVAAPAQWR